MRSKLFLKITSMICESLWYLPPICFSFHENLNFELNWKPYFCNKRLFGHPNIYSLFSFDYRQRQNLFRRYQQNTIRFDIVNYIQLAYNL